MKKIELQNCLKNINDNGVTIVVISNINFEPYMDTLLKSKFMYNNTLTTVLLINYEEYQSQGNIKKIIKADYVVVCINFDYMYPNISTDIISNIISVNLILKYTKERCCELYSYIKSQSKSPVLWFGFEDYCYQYNLVCGNIVYNENLVDKINDEIACLLKKEDTYIDFKRIVAKIGITHTYDNKGKYRWNAPYTKALVDEICNEIYNQYLIYNGITKKCIVLDCDNVLWGGILSEDGIDNILLGNSGLGLPYQDFQRYLLFLYNHGITLTICSKNDLSDVMTMFYKHSEMILREEHIACFQVNWNNKLDNIKQIAGMLNIGLEHMVFVDDSPIEIESIKAMLPEVTTILYEITMVYEQFSCINLKSTINITDIEKRNKTFRTNQSRETLKSQYESYADYIDALGIEMDIHEAMPIEFSRISELIQRTNKCTNGKRYTVTEIKERFICENITLYAISVSDCFSDLGLVGALEVEDNTLTLFSLSCRALGRGIESKLLKFIMEKHQITSFEFKEIGKNEDVKILLMESFPSTILFNCEPV